MPSFIHFYVGVSFRVFQRSRKLRLELLIRDLQLQRGVQYDGQRGPVQMGEREKRGVVHEGADLRDIGDFEEMNERFPLQVSEELGFIRDRGAIERQKLASIA